MLSHSLLEFSPFQILCHSLLLRINLPNRLLIHFKTLRDFTTMLTLLQTIFFLFQLPIQPIFIPPKVSIHKLGHPHILNMLLIGLILPQLTFSILTTFNLACPHLLLPDRILRLLTGRYSLIGNVMALSCMQKVLNLITMVCLRYQS